MIKVKFRKHKITGKRITQCNTREDEVSESVYVGKEENIEKDIYAVNIPVREHVTKEVVEAK